MFTSLMLRPFDQQHFDNDGVIEVVMHVTAYKTAAMKRLLS